jgi:hypothetical protein
MHAEASHSLRPAQETNGFGFDLQSDASDGERGGVTVPVSPGEPCSGPCGAAASLVLPTDALHAIACSLAACQVTRPVAVRCLTAEARQCPWVPLAVQAAIISFTPGGPRLRSGCGSRRTGSNARVCVAVVLVWSGVGGRWQGRPRYKTQCGDASALGFWEAPTRL